MATTEYDPTMTEAGDFDRAALETLSVDYEPVDDFAISEIDVPGSRQVWAQVRPDEEPLDEENVEGLRAVHESGGILPPIIVYRDNRGKIRVISGNHRAEMYRRAGVTHARAYVATGLEGLKVENGAVLALAYEANAGHGKQVAEAHRLRQALDLVVKGGYEIADAARALSVKPEKLRDEKEKVEATNRLEQLGVNTEPIPITAQRRIASIKNDAIAKKLGQLVPMMEQKVVTVEETVKAVNSARSERAMRSILDELGANLRAAKGGSGSTDRDGAGAGAGTSTAVSPALRNLNRALSSLLNIGVADVENAGTTAEYRRLILEKIDAAAGHLVRVKKAL